MSARFLDPSALAQLVELLRSRGFEVRGPVVVDGVLSFEPVASAVELAAGIRDEQEPGRYRLEADDGQAVFGIVHGPSGLKRFFFAPHEPLLRVERTGVSFHVEANVPAQRRLAFLGVRPCDLAALAIQDRVFLGGPHVDPYYEARRRSAFLIAVNCTHAVRTCFCASLGSGPDVTAPHDLELTELQPGFVARAGSDAGREVLAALAWREATADELAQEAERLAACARSLSRSLDRQGLPEVLYGNLDHGRWDEVAARCLACGNCTMVCPTCFCHTESDRVALDGTIAERNRSWDSCFAPDHGYVHGKNLRPHTREKYRQWLTHKLAGWVEQFGTSGCVGCGRCITWCPTGIDLTEEVAAIRATAKPA